jgi:hypothetical protein
MHDLVGVSQHGAQPHELSVSHSDPKFTRRHNFPAEQQSGYFRGRDKELAAIKSSFQACQPGEIGRCAIWGMPGIGKTQLALAYAQREFSSSNYDLIIWISGSTAEKIVDGLTSALKLLELPARAESDAEARLNALWRWLEQSADLGCERWLIIVDNLDSSAIQALRRNVPTFVQGGEILITTRREDVAKSVLRNRGKPIEILALNADDSASLLLERASLPNDGGSRSNEVLLGVVDRLGCHPLALEQAGAMMEQRKGGIEMLEDMLHGATYSTVRINANFRPSVTFLTWL